MSTIIIKLLSLMVPVALGYILKRKRMFGEKDYLIVSKIMVNITMPASVISSFATFSMDASMLGITLIAFLSNLVILAAAWILTLKHQKNLPERRLQMMLIAGFNMGNFVIPFVREFMGLGGLTITSLFDTGNTIMCLGGNYIIISSLLHSEGKKLTAKDVVKKLFGNAVLPTYILMVILSLLKVRIPDTVVSVLTPMANANSFVAVFMLGLMMEIDFSERYMKSAGAALLKKYALGIAVAVLYFTLLPFELNIRQIMVFCALAPIPSLSPIFAGEMGCDVEVAGFTAAASMLISCILLPIAAAIMGVV